ncbi:hypothetical protein LM701067_150302 [Listeria monocytogenes]|nr:hypothetical protein LM701067_150302 [Listeria monocytogenes]
MELMREVWQGDQARNFGYYLEDLQADEKNKWCQTFQAEEEKRQEKINTYQKTSTNWKVNNKIYKRSCSSEPNRHRRNTRFCIPTTRSQPNRKKNHPRRQNHRDKLRRRW